MKKIVKDYLKKLGKKSVCELTDEHVEFFFSQEHKDTPLEWAYLTAQTAIEHGGLTEEKVMLSMRKTMMTYKVLECCYILNESAIGAKGLPKRSGWIIE